MPCVEIIIISLRESSERRAQAARQLDPTQFPWSFQDAIDGAALPSFPEEYDRSKRLRYCGFDLTPGQIGCFLSHRQAWKKCVQTQKPVLVLEDDFQFQQELSEVLPIAFDSISQYEVLRLQGLREGLKHEVLKDYGKSKLVKHYHDTFGTTAYFLRPEGAKVLLEKSNRFYAPVDDFFSHDWVHRVRILSVLPYPIKPNGMPSTIGCCYQRTGKLSIIERWRARIRKLPRSTAKRFYRMLTFPGLYFGQTGYYRR